SDDWFVDFNNDSVPDIAVGRLPVQDAADAATVVGKIVAYGQGGAHSQTALLVSDIPDIADFEANSAQIAATLPAGTATQRIDRRLLGDAAARQQTLDALNIGPRLVNFNGHGSATIWRGNLLTADDAATLTNGGSLSVFTVANCLNGYFVAPFLESL